jgi:two-component system copper resistance phosphate regulon response regulator CusR
MRILLVEDDDKLAAALIRGFRQRRIDADRARDATGGRACIAAAMYDVIVLDVMLPGITGFELCATVRSSGLATPILMLTARSDVDDRVQGLEAGADDYLTKPFAFRELVARVQALARRQPVVRPTVHRVADLEVDLGKREARRGGRVIALTAKEFTLLELFILHPDQVFDRSAITARVWDENHDPFTNVIEVLVGRLRRKIDEGFEPKLIHTLRGSGYRFGL